MPLTPLPPKRWQDPDDPLYDPIRHHAWFARLLTRKKHLPALRQAFRAMQEDGISQRQACLDWFVSTRELRDFIDFQACTPSPKLPKQQEVLDEAVLFYRVEHGQHSLRHWIQQVAQHKHRFKPRPYLEQWEVDPTYMPTIIS